jgi:phenylacetate-CoA ligase
LYFRIYDLRGQHVEKLHRRYQKEEQVGISPDTVRQNLIELLDYARQNVPYYQNIINELGNSYKEDPFDYLRQMPVLSKEVIRTHFDELKSSDLSKRKWFLNASSGSTGEPVEVIQDQEYMTRIAPMTLMFAKYAGRDVGQRQVMFWGSIHDIQGVRDSLKAKAMNRLSNTAICSVYRLDPATIRRFIDGINHKPPRLIVGYTNSLIEIAKFAEQEGLKVRKQNAIISSAGTLFPEFRETIERVFQCRVYNRYGSREVGDVACERPGFDGLWVPPWGNYLEIVDPDCQPLPNGVEGEILITSFSNHAMPLIRYQIEDRGVLAPANSKNHPKVGQVLEKITGRTVETYVNVRGETVDPSHFMPIVYHHKWIRKYQVVQKSPTCITYRIVKTAGDPPQEDIDNIIRFGKRIMNDPACEIRFEYVDDIMPTSSGKFRFLINEMKQS